MNYPQRKPFKKCHPVCGGKKNKSKPINQNLCLLGMQHGKWVLILLLFLKSAVRNRVGRCKFRNLPPPMREARLGEVQASGC